MLYGKVGYPDVYFNKEDLKTMSDLATDINNYITRYIANVISGSKDLDSSWGEFVKFNRLGLDQYLKILQERYDDFNKE